MKRNKTWTLPLTLLSVTLCAGNYALGAGNTVLGVMEIPSTKAPATVENTSESVGYVFSLSGVMEQAPEWKVPSRAARKKNPLPDDPSVVAKGKLVFEAQCVSCHGTSGVGDGVAAKDLEKHPGNLTDPKVQAQSDGALFWKITTGRAPMTAFGETLSAEERWQVVRYIRTLGAGPATTEPEFMTAESLRKHLSRLARAYGPLRSALASGQKDKATQAMPALMEALQVLQKGNLGDAGDKFREAWKESLDSLSGSMKGLHSAGDLPSMRTAFATFSNAAVKTWGRFGHGESGTIWVFECAKATKAGPARWVQTDQKPENPYLGTKEVACVKVVKGIAPTRKKHE